jgi:5-formyltetrahydrofolate cyclo-ligase
MGAVPGWTLVRHTWSPPDVNASVDFPATTHGGPVTPYPDEPLFPMRMRVEDKQRLREALRAERKAHVAALPSAIKGLLFLRPPSPVEALMPKDSTVGLYHALPNEAPTRGYAKWLSENGRTIALPWFENREAPMRFRRWADPYDDTGLEIGPHRHLQPAAAAEELFPDLVVVPLIGFTADGSRLGQGGGHYDRWLAANPSVTALGLAWDCQLRDSLPSESHDRTLRGVITPTRFYGD